MLLPLCEPFRTSRGCCRFIVLFFFFQAEDGIRDVAVTGVQTCALPISGPGDVHRVSMLNGATYVGTWEEIVRQMKDDAAEWARGSLEQYMVAVAHRGRKETGVAIPATDPESFIRGSADAGLLRILH